MPTSCPLCSLFPLQIAPVENDDSYDELKRDAKTCLSLMSQGLLYPEQIPMVLSVLQEVSWLLSQQDDGELYSDQPATHRSRSSASVVCFIVQWIQ